MNNVGLVMVIFSVTLLVFRIGYGYGQKDANEFWEAIIDKYYKDTDYFSEAVRKSEK